MTIEMGEAYYADVTESDLDEMLKDNMSLDDWIEIAQEGGGYVHGHYEVNIITPNEDRTEDFEHEVYVEVEEALEKILDEYNNLLTQKSNVYRLLEEAKREIYSLKNPCRNGEISEITQATTG